MAQLMQRVMIVDPAPAAAKLLSELLRDISPCQIWTATDASKAMQIASQIDPHVVFVEQCPGLDGAALTSALRRSDMSCRKAPVIMVTSEARASAIINARDSGVHEFLRKPYTIKDLVRRLEAVTLRQRDWVEAVAYVGPDRRRFNSGDYAGPLKRRMDHAETPNAARIVQALKIVRSAVTSVEIDPHQVLRALKAQAIDLQVAAVAVSNLKLRSAAVSLAQSLAGMTALTMNRAVLEKHVTELWAHMPDGEGMAA